MRTFGKYRLVEPLASGGMADVWRAEVTGAEGVVKEVALKLVRGEHAARSDFVRMFVQEARLAARLNHANVVQVYEFDQVDGRYYLAMELVRGRHLGQVVERAREEGARFGLARAVHVVAEVAKGLAYAHRATDGGRPLGVVHRDVSPHNVLVSFEGEVKLADFGIARAMNGSELTQPGTVKGKLAYMAPEQARGAAVDARADVFSLGVVLWELCAGRRLFARESEAATFAAVMAEEPLSPPSAWNEEVPPELDAAVLAALERDPARRTRSADELAAALAAVLLRITRSPADVDVRAFVQRLFSREAALAASGAPAQEATAVRPVPVAREPQAERSEVRAPGAAEAPAAPPEHESATRTAAPGRGRRRVALPLAVFAVGAAAVGVVVVGAARRPPAGPAGAQETVAPGAGGAVVPAAAVSAGPISTSTPTAAGASRLGSPPASSRRFTPSESGGEPPDTPSTSTSTPTPTSTSTSTSTERTPETTPDSADAAAASGRARRAPLEVAHALRKLAVPPAASGEGILSVNASPWGTVTVNGERVGDAPVELRLPAGRHRLRVDVRGERGVEQVVQVDAGRRTMVAAPALR